MEPLSDLRTTRPIPMGSEITIALYPSGRFGIIDHPGLVLAMVRTR